MTQRRVLSVWLGCLLGALASSPAQGAGEASNPPALVPPAPFFEPEPSMPAVVLKPNLDRPEGIEGNFLNQVEGQMGVLSSRVVVHDSGSGGSDPLLANRWQTAEEVRLPVTGPVFVFGQVDANCPCMSSQELKMASRTGLGCKLPPLAGCELLLRGGPALTWEDPLRPERMKDQSELQVELQCRYTLLKQIKLEYQTTAAPALSLAEHDRLKQDLRLAIPLGGAGQFSIGAKHNWENTPVVKPWTEGMQFYIGLDLKH